MANPQIIDDWEQWDDCRVAAMETLFGKVENYVGHAAIPFDLGAENGGAADLIYFMHKIPGVITVTSELIGRDDQIQNDLGNYELAICHRTDEEWGPDLIRRLAYYTLDAKLQPGDTMDIGPFVQEGSSIEALLFLDYGRFEVRGRKAGVLLCIGITAKELKVCRSGRSEQVIKALQDQDVYPYTDLYRDSVQLPKKKWGLF